jgi:hypothetical protein
MTSAFSMRSCEFSPRIYSGRSGPCVAKSYNPHANRSISIRKLFTELVKICTVYKHGNEIFDHDISRNFDNKLIVVGLFVVH